MHILILSNLYPPNVIGGYERLCFEVSSALAARGHIITVLTSTYGTEVDTYPGQRVLRELRLLTGSDIYAPFAGSADERDAINRANVATALRVLDEVKPDVVFAWNLFFFDVSLLEAVQRHGPRTVAMLTDNWLLVMRNPHFVAEFFRTVVHGDTPFVPQLDAPLPIQPPRNGIHQRLRRVIGRVFGLARTPAVSVTTDLDSPDSTLEAVFGANFMRDFYAAGGLHFRNYRVVHNGVRQVPPQAADMPDRSRLVRPGVLRLLFAGRLVDLKGAHTVVEALPLIDPAALGVARVELTIVGDAQDAAYTPVLQAAIERSNCADRIELQPTVPEYALPALFAEHDIYVFPSLYEPFSLTLIHAMALGIPTVATAVGGNVEIVADGFSGLLFPKGDAAALARCITRLALDDALRAEISEGGRLSAARFTFDRMITDISAFLEMRPERPA